MASELEVSKKSFYTDFNNLSSLNKIPWEDCAFERFLSVLDDADILNTPTALRDNGKLGNKKWGLLGYSMDSKFMKDDSDDDFYELDEDDDNQRAREISADQEGIQYFKYAIINGEFTNSHEVRKAKKQDVERARDEAIHFYETALSGSFSANFQTKELQEHILDQYQKGAIDRLDIYIVTDSEFDLDLKSSFDIPKTKITGRIYYWDLKKWNDLKRSKSQRLPTNIDFQQGDFARYSPSCLETTSSRDLACYLAVFPADLVADLYDYHATSLLENNVRLFISANVKANKAIRKTIKDQPDYFFSYNNGISATAESILTKEGKILLIKDFQIVNGGQTTAAIHYSRKNDDSSLEKVQVAVKITEVKKKKQSGEVVKSIARAANTQSAVKQSDFHANDPYLLSFERMTTKLPIEDKSGNQVYYFFERMTGQYNVQKNRGRTKKLCGVWEASHPKQLIIKKQHISSWCNTMYGLPHIAASGAEKSFDRWIEDKDVKKSALNPGRYKNILGFGMLFNRTRQLIGKKNRKIYPPMIDTSVAMATAQYVMAYLHETSDGRIDYWRIYDHDFGFCPELFLDSQDNSSEFDGHLKWLIMKCFKAIAEFGGASAQESSKKLECWRYVRDELRSSNSELLERFDPFFVSAELRDERDSGRSSDEDYQYFDAIATLLSNQGSSLESLISIASRRTNFRVESDAVKSFMRKVENGSSTLTLAKTARALDVMRSLEKEGLIISPSSSVYQNIPMTLDVRKIFEVVFTDITNCFECIEAHIEAGDYEKMDSSLQVLEEMKQITEKYERERGLSLADFSDLHLALEQFEEVDFK